MMSIPLSSHSESCKPEDSSCTVWVCHFDCGVMRNCILPSLDMESSCQCCGAGAESRGAEIKLPSGAGAEITNWGSGSFLLIRDLKKFYFNKIIVAEEVTILILWVSSKKAIFKRSYKTILSRSRSGHSDLLLHGVGAERKNFGSTTWVPTDCTTGSSNCKKT